MATESEILGPLAASVGSSGGGSGGAVAQGIRNIGQAVQNKVDENNISEFHSELEQGISDTVDEGISTLFAADDNSSGPIGGFSARMRRLARAMEQGNTQIANRAKLEATRLTRQAMHENPRLRRQIAQEASLVLGNSVELSEAAMLDAMATQRSALAQDQYKRIVEYAQTPFEEGGLGVSPLIDPTSAEFSTQVIKQERKRASQDALLEQLYISENNAAYSNDQQFKLLKENKGEFYSLIDNQLKPILNRWSQVQGDPAATEAYRNSPSFVQDQVALAQVRQSLIDMAQSGVDLRDEGARAQIQEILRGPLELVDAVQKSLDDPMWTNAIEVDNEIAQYQFETEHNLRKVKLLLDTFTPMMEFMDTSLFPSMRIFGEQIIEATSPALRSTVAGIMAAEYTNNPNYTPQPSAAREYSRNVQSHAATLYEDGGFPGTVAPEERVRRGVERVQVQRSMVANLDRASGLGPEQANALLDSLSTHYAMFDSLDGSQYDEVQENTIGLLADTNILQLASTGDPMKGQVFAESASSFLEEEAEDITNRIAVLPDQLAETIGAGWNPTETPFTQVVRLESDPDTGTVKFVLSRDVEFRSNLPVGDGSKVDRLFGRRRYEGMLEDINRRATAMIRAEAHRLALETRVYDESRIKEFYRRAYQQIMGDIESAFTS